MKSNDLIDVMLKVVKLLQDNNLDYAIIGGIAVSVWSRPRATVDVDVLIAMKSKNFKKLIDILGSEKFLTHDEIMEFRRMKFLRALYPVGDDFITVDFVFSDEDFFMNVINRGREIDFEGKKIKIATPEDIILLKLMSGREHDFIDAKNIAEVQKIDKNYIKNWAEKLQLDVSKVFK